MSLSRREVLIASTLTVTIAGCLDDDDDDDTAAQVGTDDENGETDDTETDDADETVEATVRIRDTDDFGEILVGPDDMTLYNFDEDTKGGNASECYDDCAANWPPLIVDDDDPVAGEGVTASLATIERDDGSVQVTANGWPLYYFAADEEPGDVAGQGVNDVWWVLDPDGEPIRDDEMDDDYDEPDSDDSSDDFGY